MQKKKQIISGVLIGLTGMYGILLVPQAIEPQPTASFETPQQTPPLTIEKASATPEPVEIERVDLPSNTQTNVSDSVPNAPKQQEIRESVEKEVVYYPLLTANDPGYASSWALDNMNAPEAWEISTGSPETIVAVIDSGFALNHEDLEDSWYINSGETGQTQVGDRCWTGTPEDKQTNDCDDDNNGYFDDWRGWNFVYGDNNPQAGRQNQSGDGVSHGTETAGLVGATGNNATGVATLSWNTRVMPLQALTDNGPGFTSDVAAAIYYAVDNGADVINLSLGSNEADAAMVTATNYAYNNNVVVVAAAGNCGTGNEPGCEDYPAGHIGYPARNPYVIAVGATTQSNARASFSSYGAALDVTAPGSGTISTPTWEPSNQTSLYTGAVYGTSYAAPYVASLAALVKAIRPNTSVLDVTALLLATAQKPSAMNDVPYTTQFGHGIIDAHTALTVAKSFVDNGEDSPILWQAGGPRSEHSYSTNSQLGSGCEITTDITYCTVHFLQPSSSYDRFLPYRLVDAESKTGWTWSTNILNGGGEWHARATQGDYQSQSYILSTK